MPKYDYSELRGKIYAKYKNQKRFAIAMGMTEASLSKKLDALSFFTAPEIEKSMKLLGLPMEQIQFYFFTHKEVNN